MKRSLVITVLAVLAFAAILVARLPASWVVPSASSKVSCAQADGTLWSGGCTGLSVQGQNVGDVTWELHPLELLSGKLAAHVVVSRPAGATPAGAQADLEIGFGQDITARHVKADFPFDPTLAPQLHLDFLGSVHTDLALVHVKQGALAQLQGEIQVHDLRESGKQPSRSGSDQGSGLNFGSYSLTFPGSPGEQTGHLRDLGGPLSVAGTVKLTNEPGVVAEGLVAARPTAPADLQNQLRFLGSPDAQGRRPFSFASTF